MIKGLGYLKSLKRSLIGFGISSFMVLGGSFVNFGYGYEYVDCTTALGSSQCIKVDPFETLNMSNYQVSFNGSNINFYDVIQGHNFSGIYGKRGYGGTLYTTTRGIFKDGQYINLIYSEKQLTGYYAFSGFTCIADDYRDCMYSSSSYFSIYHLNDLSEFSGHNYDYVILPYSTMSSVLADGYGICLHFPVGDKFLCFGLHGGFSYGYLPEGVQYQTIGGNTFLNTQSDYFPYFPGVGVDTGSSEGSISGDLDNILTGDYVYAECTWNDVLLTLESEGYNKYMCYGGLDNYDLYDSSLNYNPIPGTGFSVADIRGWSGSRAWDSFTEWFMFWNGIYRDDYNNYNAMWESYPAVYYTYFQLFNTYQGGSLDPNTILNYCQLRTLDSSVMNNSAGGYFKPVCETVIREKQTGLWEARMNGTLYSGGVYTGDVPISVNWNGVGNMSGSDVSDGMNFLQNFFNLTKSKLSTNFPNNFSGVLPNYIIVFLLALILFRFLSH